LAHRCALTFEQYRGFIALLPPVDKPRT